MRYNRNRMYEYLKETDLRITRRKLERKGYYLEFVLDESKGQTFCDVIFDWGYVRNVGAIALCAWEFVLIGRYGDMKLNMNYRDCKSIEVRVFDEIVEH